MNFRVDMALAKAGIEAAPLAGDNARARKDFRGYSPMGAEPVYRMSFTVGGLFLHEARDLARAWFTCRNWGQVRKQVPDNLFVGTGRPDSARRMRNEVIRRISRLEEAELSHLAECGMTDARALVWIATCREYRVLADFARETLQDRYRGFGEPVRPVDFDRLLDDLGLTHPEVANLAESTRKRLRSVAFRMMREAELIDAAGRVQTLHLGASLLELLRRRPGPGLDCIPGAG
ncbi:DUF1819 family protein [Rhodovulum sp. ES.010]|uniref:DUF1819 family protein n=1 Tax=Rhodovulum sp. ES.010 TaxID=1882821 RepID=UPI0020CA077D|nr:DUF1819 family protein [Rhodovulum sp. ES.010]